MFVLKMVVIHILQNLLIVPVLVSEKNIVKNYIFDLSFAVIRNDYNQNLKRTLDYLKTNYMAFAIYIV